MASKEDDAEVLCGVGKFRPKFLQFFNNPKALCTFIGLYLFIHGRLTYYFFIMVIVCVYSCTKKETKSFQR